ncbi:transposable element Tc1 transposase [Trichonephila clavipes]|nr:transposable element Tc1 transposase [Trichonephila clavipes]
MPGTNTIADMSTRKTRVVIDSTLRKNDREAGWPNRRIGRHLGRSDMVVARCWQQWITEDRVYRRGGQCRLDFCRPRATWSVTDWRRVIFSDESRFSLSADDHRTRVWRRTGQRSDPAFIVERHTAISQGVTVWGAISWDTRSSLVVLQGILTAPRYVDDILTPIVLPMLSSRPGAIYQQDNARPHTARLSQQCLQGYDVLPWPARLPDLSPIEHVWDAGKAISAVPRYRRINCADAKTMAGSSTGGHK